MNLSGYAKERFEDDIEDDDIANEIKKAFLSYCNSTVPSDFTTYENKLGYCYIFVRNISELMYKHRIPTPSLSITPEELDDGIDKDMIDSICEDIEDFVLYWTDSENVSVNEKAIPLLKKALPDAAMITNILAIAIGMEDEELENNDEIDEKTKAELEELNRQLRENRIKQAVLMQAYIKEIKKKNFPIDEKMLILNFFKEYSRDPNMAYDTLITSPAFFSPIIIDKLAKSGIKEKDIKDVAKKKNKEIGDFLKTLKI